MQPSSHLPKILCITKFVEILPNISKKNQKYLIVTKYLVTHSGVLFRLDDGINTKFSDKTTKLWNSIPNSYSKNGMECNDRMGGCKCVGNIAAAVVASILLDHEPFFYISHIFNY